MVAPDPSAAARLDQLERFLAEDPHNLALRADACDEALRAGAADRAEGHIQAAGAAVLADATWAGRAARAAMARCDWPQALERLAHWRALAGEHPVIAHDAALAHFAQGQHARARAALAPWLASPLPPDMPAHTVGALQVLWLRASHHLGELTAALEWALERQARHELQPSAAGVASLVAVDLGQFMRARELARLCIDAGAANAEALLAAAAVALGRRDTGQAQQLLRDALALAPQEGRIWSALGMASLQARDLAQARVQFARATALMPGHIGTWHGLGWSCVLLQDVPAALAAFQQALALDPNFAESHGAVGLALMLAGRTAEAEPHLARAERLDRHNVTGRYARVLASGKPQDRAALRELATRLLDRPGLFRPRLSDEIDV